MIDAVTVHKADVDDWLPNEELSVGSTNAPNAVDYQALDYFGIISIGVKDSGVGMTAENLSMLFQEGVQFNANQLQDGKGSGLGLWVSKGFAKRHNGDIRAESEGIGMGSTFTLELPCYLPRCLASAAVGIDTSVPFDRSDRRSMTIGGTDYIPLAVMSGSRDSGDAEHGSIRAASSLAASDHGDAIAHVEEAPGKDDEVFVSLDMLATKHTEPKSHDIHTSEVFKVSLSSDRSVTSVIFICSNLYYCASVVL